MSTVTFKNLLHDPPSVIVTKNHTIIHNNVVFYRMRKGDLIMAKSKAKKSREKLVREGRRNPNLGRGSWQGVNPIEKKTPTFVELKQKQNNKHKKRYQPGSMDDTFYLLVRRIALLRWNL
jgi:hypothetical protein